MQNGIVTKLVFTVIVGMIATVYFQSTSPNKVIPPIVISKPLPPPVLITTVSFLDYGAALKKATETNKPILMYAHSKSCVNCTKLEMDVFKDKDSIDRLNKDYVLCDIDVDNNQAVATRYKIKATPTVVIINNDKVLSLEGYTTKQDFFNWLDQKPEKKPLLPIFRPRSNS